MNVWKLNYLIITFILALGLCRAVLSMMMEKERMKQVSLSSKMFGFWAQ